MNTILFLSHSASRTGAPLLLQQIAALLDPTRYRTCFAVAEDGPLLEEFRSLGPTSIESLYPDELKYWRELKRVQSRIKFLKHTEPDLVYCNTIHPAKWLLYARMLGIPTLTHVHELSSGFAELSLLERFIIKTCTQQFIAVSSAVGSYLTDQMKIASEKVHVVHAGIQTERFVKNRDSSDLRKTLGIGNHIVIGTVGRITAVKGNDLFLELASSLRNAMAPAARIKFLVIGTTEDRLFTATFRTLLQKYHLGNDVVVLEDIRDVAPYYALMDMYVSTAREDPFPLVVMEAMASGKPVVAFAVGGIPEAVPSDCGILIGGLNLEVMQNAIVQLLKDPARRARLGAVARTHVQQHLNLRNNVGAIQQIIDSLVQ